MISAEDEARMRTVREELAQAASARALRVLTVDSVEASLTAMTQLRGASVPDELVSDLWGLLDTADDLIDAEEALQLRHWGKGYLPVGDWADQDIRSEVVSLAAVAIETAFNVDMPLRDRANKAAYSLADVHAYADALASGEWSMDEVPTDIRSRVIDPVVPYHLYCISRQIELMRILSENPHLPISSAQEITARGVDFLRRALADIVEAGRI